MGREQSMEKPEEEPKEPSVLEEDDFKEFIEFRKIKPEDFKIIEELSQYPKDFFIYHHNSFGINQEIVKHDLEGEIKSRERDIKETQDEKQKSFLEKEKKFAELFLEITKKYDSCVSKHLNVVFERRDKKKFKTKLRDIR